MCQRSKTNERCPPPPAPPTPALGTPDAWEPRARPMGPHRSRAGGEVDTLAENPCPGHPQIP